MADNETTKLERLCDSLALKLTVISSEYVTEGDWRHVKTQLEIHGARGLVWAGPFKQGTACFIGEADVNSRGRETLHVQDLRLTLNGANSWALNPKEGDEPQSVSRERIRRHIAKMWKAPAVADVMHCIISDGAAYFDGVSFRDWCDEYGIEGNPADALETYNACRAIGETLQSALPGHTIEALRAAAQDY